MTITQERCGIGTTRTRCEEIVASMVLKPTWRTTRWEKEMLAYVGACSLRLATRIVVLVLARVV